MEYRKYGWRRYLIGVIAICAMLFLTAGYFGYPLVSLGAIVVAFLANLLIPKQMQEELSKEYRDRTRLY